MTGREQTAGLPAESNDASKIEGGQNPTEMSRSSESRLLQLHKNDVVMQLSVSCNKLPTVNDLN